MKCMKTKIYPSIKLKQLPAIFILNDTNNWSIMQKVCMTLLVRKHLEELFKLLITRARFLFTIYFSLIVQQWHFIKCHHSINHFSKHLLKKNKLVLYWIILRIIPVGLALLYRCYPLHEKCPNTEVFLVCVFLYSDWI